MSEFIQTDTDHLAYSQIRLKAYSATFGRSASKIYNFNELDPGEPGLMIDVLVYPIAQPAPKGPVFALVTNGLSDFPIFDPDEGVTERCELIQYFYAVTDADARRLYAVAQLAVLENINLEDHDTIALQAPDPFDRPNSLFLRPLVKAHARLEFTIDGDTTILLWHVPISDDELEVKREHGAAALIQRMAETAMPWVYDGQREPLA